MDPDAALRELREVFRLIEQHRRMTTEQVEHLAEVFTGLDGWLASGGTLPGAWHLSTCMAHDCRAGATSAAEHGGE